MRPPKPEVNWLDRAILAVAPRWGSNRIVRRTGFKAWLEGAASDRMRQKDWYTQELSSDAGLDANLESARARSWDLYRNDPYIHGLVENRVTSIVGRGFRPQSQVDAEEIGISPDFAGELDRTIEKVFERWSANTDPTGVADLSEQLQQIQRDWDVRGESFVEFTNAGAADKDIPLAIRVIPPTMVATPPSKTGDPNVRMGIEYDSRGRRVAYWVRRSEPGDNLTFDETFRRVPARFGNGNPRVVHLYVQEFPRQSRGWPLVSAILNTMKDIKDLSEAAIIREQIISCFTVFLADDTDALTRATNAASESDSSGRLIERISPGKIMYGREGQEPKFANPTTPVSSFDSFVKQYLHTAAAGVQWPASWLTGDYRNFNYSAGRLESIAGVETIRCRQQRIICRFLRHLWTQVWEQARFLELVDVPESLFNSYRAAFLNHRWIAPGRPYIDPDKEIKAAEKAIELKLTTKSEVAQSVYGVDWYDEVAPQIAKENERERELGIESTMQTEGGGSTPPQTTNGTHDVEQETFSYLAY